MRPDIEWNRAGGRPLAELTLYLLHDSFEIARQLFVGVMRRHHRRVLSVIAEVEHQQVEFLQQVSPVRKVRVGGKAVAVREEQANAVGIAVAPHANPGAVVERNVKRHAWGGKHEMHGGPAMFPDP